QDGNNGYVHLSTLHVRLTLTALPDSKTKVEYIALIDPGGHIPAWANSLFSDAPLNSLKNARAILRQSKNDFNLAAIKTADTR
ncbi:MAG TPA: hypothetical protein VFM46_13140, partial [Pseudomonadales bacterium]|nr:hypothetical protein [Pseudomonadales bacterium]